MGDYKVVISRYDENIEWVKVFNDYVVYNKGNNVGISEEILNRTYNLPNVGIDCDVILRYITTHYYQLPRKIAFCQGRYDDHYNLSVSEFAYGLLTLDGGYSILDYSTENCFEQDINYPHFNIKEYRSNIVENYQPDYDLQTWWKEVSGEEYIQKPIVFWGCIFCVEKSLIYRRPLSFYQKLHTYVIKHKNPVETQFLERSWANIFKI